MQNVWARVLVFYGAVGGTAWLNWIIAQEFNGVTVALFLTVSLIFMAGMLSATINPTARKKDASSTSD